MAHGDSRAGVQRTGGVFLPRLTGESTADRDLRGVGVLDWTSNTEVATPTSEATPRIGRTTDCRGRIVPERNQQALRDIPVPVFPLCRARSPFEGSAGDARGSNRGVRASRRPHCPCWCPQQSRRYLSTAGELYAGFNLLRASFNFF